MCNFCFKFLKNAGAHNGIYYSAIKMKEIIPFVTAWMDLESIMLSEISPSEKDEHHMISLICGI